MIKDVQVKFNLLTNEFKQLPPKYPLDQNLYDKLISTLNDLNMRSESFSVIIRVTGPPRISETKHYAHFFTELAQSLTRRELEVFNLAIRGYSNKLISDELFIAIETVKSHRKSIVRKAGVGKMEDIKNLLLEAHNVLE